MILKSQGQHKPKQHLDKVWGCRISNFAGTQTKDYAYLASIDPASESLCRYAVSAASGARCRGKQEPLQKCIYSPNGPVWLVLLRKIVCVCSFIKMVPIEADRSIAAKRHACLRSGECTADANKSVTLPTSRKPSWSPGAVNHNNNNNNNNTKNTTPRFLLSRAAGCPGCSAMQMISRTEVQSRALSLRHAALS